jgi:hypothetical protein
VDGPAADTIHRLGRNLVFGAVMTVLMLSWRYGNGVGWFWPMYYGDRPMFMMYGWQLFALLLLNRGSLRRCRSSAGVVSGTG